MLHGTPGLHAFVGRSEANPQFVAGGARYLEVQRLSTTLPKKMGNHVQASICTRLNLWNLGSYSLAV